MKLSALNTTVKPQKETYKRMEYFKKQNNTLSSGATFGKEGPKFKKTFF